MIVRFQVLLGKIGGKAFEGVILDRGEADSAHRDAVAFFFQIVGQAGMPAMMMRRRPMVMGYASDASDFFQ